MLIQLDPSLDQFLIENPDDKVVAAFENLAACCWEGKHVLYSEMPLLHALARYQPLSQRGRGLYQRLLSEAATTAALPKLFEVSILVTHGTFPPRREDAVFEMPLDTFHDSARVQATILLGENLNDARFYEIIGQTALQKESWTSTLHLSCNLQGGGGDTTVQEFRACRASGKLILCIADSDKKFPKPEPGETARKILGEQERTSAVSEVYVLEVRDAENLIPHPVLNLTVEQQENKLNAIGYFRQAFSHLYPWFDVKKGLLPFKVPAQDPWPESEGALKQNAFHWENDCRSDACPKEKCTCRLVPGLGDKVLAKVLTCLSDPIFRKIHFTPHLDDELEIIGNKVITWCIASQPMFA